MVKPMPSGMTTPSLAESWNESRDHLTYTFTMRKNAKFHDGSPVTPEDVKHVMHVPIYELAFISGVGPKVEESGAGLIPGFAYSAPFEDLKLKK